MNKVFLVVSFLIASLQSHAGEVSAAKVAGVYCGIYGGANMCSIYFNKTISDSPTCVQQSTNIRMQISTDTDVGKAMLSLALSANATGKLVKASGTGTCTVWPDTEDLNVIFISPLCNETSNTWGCTNQ